MTGSEPETCKFPNQQTRNNNENPSLQGGLFNKESVYPFSSSDVKRLTGQFNIGLIVKTKTLYFEYTRTTITPEFEGDDTTNWSGIKIGFSF